jgi:lysophospholipase L1-like esterase
MKRILSLLLAIGLLGGASLVAQETKKAPAKKAAAPAVKLPSQPADVAAPKFDPKTGQVSGGFLTSHESFVEVAKKGEAQVVFLGDSITAGWGRQAAIFDKEFGQYKAANFGIGGDRTQHVLWRVENGEFEGIKPKAVVLMIGTNNSGAADNSPAQIAAGIKNIISAIHQRSPNTKVLLLAIFPRGATEANNPGRAKNQAVNALIAKFDDGQKVRYLDIGAKFLTADGTLEKSVMPDLLHLNAVSYQIWADAIREPLAALVR